MLAVPQAKCLKMIFYFALKSPKHCLPVSKTKAFCEGRDWASTFWDLARGLSYLREVDIGSMLFLLSYDKNLV